MKTILFTCLVAGTLDAFAATALFLATAKKNPALLFKAISAAAVGPGAFEGGNGFALLGLALHYFIALCWTIFYFTLFAKWFPCGSIPANAITYGMFTWIMMNLVIVPLSKAEPRPFSPVMALVNIVILIIAVGLPCAWVTHHYPL